MSDALKDRSLNQPKTNRRTKERKKRYKATILAQFEKEQQEKAEQIMLSFAKQRKQEKTYINHINRQIGWLCSLENKTQDSLNPFDLSDDAEMKRIHARNPFFGRTLGI